MSTELSKPERSTSSVRRFIRKYRLPLGLFSALIILAAITLPFALYHTPSSTAASMTSSSRDYSTMTAHGASSSANSSSAASATSVASSSTTSSKQAASTSSTSSSNGSTSARDVIETANLHMSVKNVSQATDKLTQLTTSVAGFVARMQETSNPDGTSANQNQSTSLTLRVPESDFQHFIKGARGLGQVQSFTQSGQDVTDEHNTLTARLTELNSESKAYTRLYEKAQSMKDMLQIQQSLSQVQSQIDQAKTQLHQLNQSISLATINITLSSTISSLPQANMTTSNAFSSSLHFMKVSGHALVIFLAWVLPWAALLSIILVVCKLALRHKKK